MNKSKRHKMKKPDYFLGGLVGGPFGSLAIGAAPTLLGELLKPKEPAMPIEIPDTMIGSKGAMMAYGGEYPMGGNVQLEKGEMFQLPNDVFGMSNATTTHENMPSSMGTDFLPSGTEVFSQRNKMTKKQYMEKSPQNAALINQVFGKSRGKKSPSDFAKYAAKGQKKSTINSAGTKTNMLSTDMLKQRNDAYLGQQIAQLNKDIMPKKKSSNMAKMSKGGTYFHELEHMFGIAFPDQPMKMFDGGMTYNYLVPQTQSQKRTVGIMPSPTIPSINPYDGIRDVGTPKASLLQTRDVPNINPTTTPSNPIGNYPILAAARTGAGLASTIIANSQKMYNKANLDTSAVEGLRTEIPTGDIFNQIARQQRAGAQQIQAQTGNSAVTLANLANLNAQAINQRSSTASEIARQNVGLYNQKQAARQQLANQQFASDQQYNIDKAALQNQKKLNVSAFLNATVEQFYQDYLNKKQEELYKSYFDMQSKLI